MLEVEKDGGCAENSRAPRARFRGEVHFREPGLRGADLAISWRLSGPRRIFGEPIESAVPAAPMPVALAEGFENRLPERHLRLAAVLGEGDRDQGLVAASPVLAIPREGVDHFFFQAEDGIRAATVTGVQTCALPI